MRFWDTSALIPLVVSEPSTARVRRWLREDPEVIVWTLARVELLSALARRKREEPKLTSRLLAARRDLLSAWEPRRFTPLVSWATLSAAVKAPLPVANITFEIQVPVSVLALAQGVPRRALFFELLDLLRSFLRVKLVRQVLKEF